MPGTWCHSLDAPLCSAIKSSKDVRTTKSGDSKSISRAPGVGPKTAARVVLELKDKFAKLFPTLAEGGDGALSEAASSVFNATGKLADAQTALQALGYSRSETAAAMRNVDVNADVETIIKQALNALLKS